MKLADLPMLTDANVDPAVVAHLRGRGIDVLDVVESGWWRKADTTLLAIAHDDGRVVVTHDSDFGKLAIPTGEPVAGILFLRPGHHSTGFTTGTVDAASAADIEVDPPFVVVARRRGDRVTVRYRPLAPPEA